MFSRKKIQSMPCFGTRTGRTLAKRSSSLRMATLQLSMLGQGSPLRGVVVGPLSVMWYFLISARTSSGMAFLWAARFSMVSPSMSLMIDFAALDFVLEQEVQNAFGFVGDERADAVSGQDADLDRLELAVIDPVRHGFDPLHALHLVFEQLAEMVLGSVDGGVYP